MMLSRIAENAFWMGRYIERAESLTRVLAVTESFAADQADEDAWTPVLNVFADAETFAERGKPVTAVNVARFYMSDAANPGSILSSVRMARENARSLRHLISTESWRQLSVFQDFMTALAKRRLAISKLSENCEEIRLACCAHRGMMETTWYRDEAWHFHRLGGALERADQVTRLLDMKTFQSDSETDAAPMPDVAWWNTLLRSASGYHAFQRQYSFNPQPEDAVAFLLHDLQFPRSVRGAAEAAFAGLETLERDFDAKPGPSVKEAARTFAERLSGPPQRLAGRALHRYLDQIQRDIIALAKALNERYFSPG